MKHSANAVSAVADKTVEEVIDGRSFGNLSKSVPLAIVATGAVVALVIVAARGGDYDSLLDALLVIGGAVGAGAVGSATTYFGDSQTQKDLKAVRAANTVPVETSAGEVRSLAADSSLAHGSWKKNVESAEPVDSAVTAPEFYETPVVVEDDSITPAV
ncbi:hypothetical protein [uncultured Rothia sp.]|uniref:hypothetical protein n=1 Tax=uncultured Rothia sp. TaxID=316088 RepID=UPI003216F718